jgi:hypothetical protein
MPCIEVPEVAYLCGYLVVSARLHTPDSGLILAYFSVTRYLNQRHFHYGNLESSYAVQFV